MAPLKSCGFYRAPSFPLPLIGGEALLLTSDWWGDKNQSVKYVAVCLPLLISGMAPAAHCLLLTGWGVGGGKKPHNHRIFKTAGFASWPSGTGSKVTRALLPASGRSMHKGSCNIKGAAVQHTTGTNSSGPYPLSASAFVTPCPYKFIASLPLPTLASHPFLSFLPIFCIKINHSILCIALSMPFHNI